MSPGQVETSSFQVGAYRGTVTVWQTRKGWRFCVNDEEESEEAYDSAYLARCAATNVLMERYGWWPGNSQARRMWTRHSVTIEDLDLRGHHFRVMYGEKAARLRTVRMSHGMWSYRFVGQEVPLDWDIVWPRYDSEEDALDAAASLFQRWKGYIPERLQ